VAETETEAAYARLIAEHARQPHGRGRPMASAVEGRGTNPRCGDEVTVGVERLEAGVLRGVWFEAQACALCVASASLLVEAMEGVDLSVARQQAECRAETVPGATGRVLRAIVQQYPQRRRCVELPWSALENALHDADSHG